MQTRLKLLGVFAGLALAAGGASSAAGAILAYEGFDYEVAELHGQAGGFGFAGPWERTLNGTEAAAVFDVSLDGTSMQTPVYPSTPTGGRLSIVGPGPVTDMPGNNTRILRPLAQPFSLAEDGVLYASFLIQKDVSMPTTNNNLEFNLGPSNLVRTGSTSNDQWFLNVATNAFGTVQLSTTYFVVARLEAFAAQDNVRSVLIFDPTREVPVEEPVTWDSSNTFSSSAEISTVQFWIGRIAAGQFDEIRIGETWHDVTHAVPEFPPPATPGDFNSDGNVDGADFVIWQTNFPNNSGAATLDIGDANGDGNVDGADFVIWQTNFPTIDGGQTVVPEPASMVLMLIGMLACTSTRWRLR